MGVQPQTETIREPTPPDSWARLKDLFQGALDQPPAAREAWLRANASDEPALVAEVLALLAAEKEGSLDVPEPSAPATATALIAGLSQVGPYLIERELARGGMGRVFRARRENPRRAAAVKLMNRALHDQNAIRRFEYESQILADLNHPNVAHVYESGTVDHMGERIPWYAMELVEGGRPLDDFMRERKPTLEQTVALFLQVCDGVHHAHQRGIIHRDLKPANVLVDAHGRVKLIDFGIAKSVTPDLDHTPDLTAQGEVMGTLAYMSPEQTSSRSGALDVRVDVYALGIILYRMCTGKMPYELHRDRIREAVTTICETPPDPGHLDRADIPTDLRLIVFKALQKRAEDRYDSVAALSADLRRYLAGEPIEARPPSLVYQLRRFAARNRLVVGAAASVFLALAVGAAVSTWGLIQAERERDRAEQARAQAETERAEAEKARDSAEKARDFATSILAEADPWESKEPDILLRKVLERASERLDTESTVDPRTEVEARETLRRVFQHLGELEAAEREARRALALLDLDPALESQRPELLNAVAGVLLMRDEIDEADQLVQQSLALHRERYGEEDERTWDAELLAAGVLEARGQMHEARDAYVSLAARATAKLGADSERTLEALDNLGEVQHSLGDLSAAEESFRMAWVARADAKGPQHPETLAVYGRLIGVVIDQGRLEDADRELRNLISASTEVLGEHHTATAAALGQRAMVLRRMKRPAEAIPLAREVLAIAHAVHGEEHINTLRATNNLALALSDAGHLDEAATFYDQLETAWAKRDADAEASYLVVALNHGLLLDKLHRKQEGIATLDAAIARARNDYPPEFWLLEYSLVSRAKIAGEDLEQFKTSLKSEKARALAGLSDEREPG